MALAHIDYYSEVLSRSARMDVLLPEGEAARKQPWKLLLLLHGMTDDHTIWQRRTTVEEFVSDKNLCVLMPTTYLGFYTDTRCGEKYFTHISDEVPRIARKMFPAITRDRRETFVAGLSMGGYGAFKCALARPDLFSCAASLSGVLNVAGVADLNGAADMAQFWTDIFGPSEGIPDSENDLLALSARQMQPRPKLFILCGTEDFLYPMNAAFHDHLNALGYRHAFHTSAGSHDWAYWEREIRNAISWMLEEEK